MKTVFVVGSRFNCLPGHVALAGVGKAATLRVALQRAVAAMLQHKQLKHRRPESFFIGVTVSTEKNPRVAVVDSHGHIASA